jgi:hypothetical protein
MDSDFNKIKKAMSEGHEQVPPELSWDNMKGGILGEMERLQSLEEDKKDRKPFFFIYRIGGITIITLALFLGYNVYWKTTYKASEPSVSLSSDEAFPGEALSDGEYNTPPPSSQNVAKPNPVFKKPTTSRPIFDEAITNEASTITPGKQEAAKLSSSNLTDSDIIATEVPQASINSTEGAAPSSGRSVNAASPGTPMPVLKPIGQKSFMASPTLHEHYPAPVALAAINTEHQQASSDQRARQLFITSGATVWSMGYGNIKPERASFEEALVSFHTQMLYQHTLKKGYFFFTGLQYQQLDSRLRWSTTIDNYQITLEDTIAAVQHNIITGQQQLVRGDVDVEVSAQRNVQHYNRTQLYQVPLAIGKRWEGQKLQFDLFVGSVFNVYTQNRGRSVYQQQLLDYDGSETVLMKNQWTIHALAGSTISYQLNEKWGIATSIQAQKSIQNWSRKEPGIEMKPALLSWSIGMSYRL